MITAEATEYYRHCQSEYLSNYIKERLDNSVELREGVIYALILFFAILAFNWSKPLLAKPTEYLPPPKAEIQITQAQFEKNIANKYKTKYIYYPADGIAHIKKIKYINSKPIKINIVEINTKVNKNLIIKPKTANKKLNSKTSVRKMAQSENAIIAINAGYFKPQTGVPLGALVIDGKVLTGPIYNRVGIGFYENQDGVSYAMDKVGLEIFAYTASNTLKIDNINQPRMSQAYTLLYTSEWGNISPVPPKDGYNMLIQNNKITKISANPIPIGENEFVISSSKEKISAFAKEKDVKLIQNITGQLKNADHIIAAGPYLVKNSEVFVDIKTQKFQAIAGKNPRSAIGYTNDGTLIIVTVDGREQSSVGMTLNELAYLMKSLGCKDAMNFDGGSSSALFVKNRIVNDALNKEGALVSNSLIIKETEENVQISSLN